MKIRQIIDRILEVSPNANTPCGFDTVDQYKFGDPDQECTGIASCCFASVNVIKEAQKLGANLIICHEPVFYANPDRTEWLREGKSIVYDGKAKMLSQKNMVVWRDHDHLHAHKPDIIFYGIGRELGWLDYVISEPGVFRRYRLPERRLIDLVQELKDKIGLENVRYIGDPEAVVSVVDFCAHLGASGGIMEENHAKPYLEGVDVLIPGEIIDWTAAAYARDAGELGVAKAMINTGHFNMEELGMKYAAEWFSEVLEGKVPVYYVKSSDPYRFL